MFPKAGTFGHPERKNRKKEGRGGNNNLTSAYEVGNVCNPPKTGGAGQFKMEKEFASSSDGQGRRETEYPDFPTDGEDI